MQEVQPINGGVVGGRLLLRRLNHHHHQQQQQQQQQLQQQHQGVLQTQALPQQAALKCPRCDSLNTKFCYYNNYNLSQPRHFCKNCRRYWTKGGVLRNVPVGGGCRKSKRSCSSSKSKSSSSTSSNSRKTGLSSHSSSESSSTPSAVGGAASLFQIPEVGFEPLVDSTNNNIFSGDINEFMSLITTNNNNDSSNNNNNISNENSSSGGYSVVVDEGNNAAATASFSEFLQNHQGVQDWDMEKICGVQDQKIGASIDLVDQTVRFEDFLQNRGSSVGFTTLDWHLTAVNDNNNHQGLYDVPDNSTVDHQAFWNQSTTAVHHHDHQWSDSTTSHLPLFLP